MKYIAKIVYEDNSYQVEFPDVPGCYTYGETLDEALAMAKDALDLLLEAKLDDKNPLPQSTLSEDPQKGLYAIQVNNQLALAYTSFEALRRQESSHP